MQLSQAISLIQSAIPSQPGTWADMGAGTGLFTEALDQILPAGSTIIAVDKSPHALWSLRLERNQLRIEDGNFERKMDLPPLDGILMANALHYASDPVMVLQNLLSHLKGNGQFVLLEYNTDTPRPPWVPFPISKTRLPDVAGQAGFGAPEWLGGMPSAYGHSEIYVARLRPSGA